MCQIESLETQLLYKDIMQRGGLSTSAKAAVSLAQLLGPHFQNVMKSVQGPLRKAWIPSPGSTQFIRPKEEGCNKGRALKRFKRLQVPLLWEEQEKPIPCRRHTVLWTLCCSGLVLQEKATVTSFLKPCLQALHLSLWILMSSKNSPGFFPS